LLAASAVELHGHWTEGLRSQASAYAAAVYAVAGLQAIFALLAGTMGVFTVARSVAGRLSHTRRACYDTTMMMWHYTVAQGLLGLGLVHAFPRLAG
jgi:cytochrome c oxidase subunit I+III